MSEKNMQELKDEEGATHFPGLIEGRIVHYVLPDYEHCHSVGEHRPAIVVNIWRDAGYPPEDGVCDMQVFTNYGYDFGEDDPASEGVLWATKVEYSSEKELGTWHWIEHA